MHVRLSEHAHIAAYHEALYGSGHIGMCLRGQSVDGGGWASSCSPLLRIRGPMIRGDDGHLWIDTLCIGRNKIVSFDEDPTLVYDTAYVVPMVDITSDNSVTGAGKKPQYHNDEKLMETVCALYKDHLALRDSLRTETSKLSSSSVPPALWLSDSEATSGVQRMSIHALTNHRSTMLRERSPDVAPASSLAALHAFWNVDSEQAALHQLTSFTAFSFLSPEERLMALRSTNTAARLRLARKALFARNAKLQAKLAIELAMEGKRGQAN